MFWYLSKGHRSWLVSVWTSESLCSGTRHFKYINSTRTDEKLCITHRLDHTKTVELFKLLLHTIYVSSCMRRHRYVENSSHILGFEQTQYIGCSCFSDPAAFRLSSAKNWGKPGNLLSPDIRVITFRWQNVKSINVRLTRQRIWHKIHTIA